MSDFINHPDLPSIESLHPSESQDIYTGLQSENMLAEATQDAVVSEDHDLTVNNARTNVEDVLAEIDNSVSAKAQQQITAQNQARIDDTPEVKYDSKKSRVRAATYEDLDRLVDIDLMMFGSAYGEKAPAHTEVKDMLASRLRNIEDGAGHMLVCEVDGEVNGFCTVFRTAKTWDDFSSWEETTNNGTLDNVVEPEGKYVYVANMTVTPKGSETRAMQKIMVNLIALSMEEGIEKGFFVSRMPQFTKWLKEEGVDYLNTTDEDLDKLAHEYSEKTSVSKKGKEEPYDYELRAYTRSGFDKGSLVRAGFSDDESLCYGVTFCVPIPLAGKPKLLRVAAAKIFLAASKSTKLMEKLF